MEDATERRKVQNRLAQRAYRKLYSFFPKQVSWILMIVDRPQPP
jgi:hypothetical protein